MSSTAKGVGRGRLALALVALLALAAVAGHFIADAACPGESAPVPAVCGADLTHGAAEGPGAGCGWHTGLALPLLLAIAAPLILTQPHRIVSPQALFDFLPRPLLPPRVTLTA